MEGLKSVLFCKSCSTVDNDGNVTCAFCDTKLITTQRRRIGSIEQKVDKLVGSVVVIESLDSPWGTLRLAISKRSNFCPYAYWVVGESEIELGYNYGSADEYAKPSTRTRYKGTKLVRETRSQEDVEMTESSSFEHKGRKRSDPGERTWCPFRVEGHAPANEIRAMINDDYSDDSQKTAWRKLGKVNLLQWILFVGHLKETIAEVEA